MSSSILIQRLVLRNYRSIGEADISLGPLTFLVGPNGSGKSNCLDGLRFVADSLRTSLDHAIRDRGGINEVRRRSSGHPTHFGIRLEFRLAGARGHYAFEIAAREAGGWSVKKETCTVRSAGTVFVEDQSFEVESGQVIRSTISSPPAAAPDRLYLVHASGHVSFRPVFEALQGMGFYNLNPDRIRDLQPPDQGELLQRDGANLAAVLGRLTNDAPDAKALIEQYLGRIVPGVVRVDPRSVGPKETLEYRQQVKGARAPWRFYAANMSDGTLRATGVLVALFQGHRNGAPVGRLIGIEEPEVALHPAAAGVLLEALRRASSRVQVVVTSHSPELLDDESIQTDELRAVTSEAGETRIGPLDERTRSILREQLFTAGELLRMDQLTADRDLAQPKQLSLFEVDGDRDEDPADR